MHKYLVMALIGLTATAAAAQTQIDLSTQTKRVDFSKAILHKAASDGYASAIHLRGGTDVLQDRCARRGEFVCLYGDQHLVGAGWNYRIQLLGGRQQPDPEMPGPQWQCLRYRQDGRQRNRQPVGGLHRRRRYAPNVATHGGAVAAVADPGSNGVAYRSGAGTATAANANQLSGPFFCQDAGISGAYSCNLTPGHHRVHNRDDLLVSREYGRHGKRHAQSERAGTENDCEAGEPILGRERHPLRTVGDGDLRWYEPADAEPGGQCSLDRLRADRRGNGAGGRLHVLPDWRYRERSATSRHGDANQPGKYGHCGHSGFQPGRTTLPMKSGSTSAMPSACTVGEAYFATDAGPAPTCTVVPRRIPGPNRREAGVVPALRSEPAEQRLDCGTPSTSFQVRVSFR